MGFWSQTRRLAHLASVVARHGVAHAVGRYLPRWPWLTRRLPASDLTGPERLCTVCEDMGGSMVKFGQMLSLQPDIISLEYCNALFNLLDRVKPFGMEQVEQTFVEEFGKTTGAIFDAFEQRPLATASIGQVHVATLNGRKVAVKVQRPEVVREFGGDIGLMTAAVRNIHRVGLKRLEWMVEPMSEFVAWTREELDFRSEARYMEQLRRNARGNAVEYVPEVEWKYTSRRTLVMEFLEGVTVLDYLRAVEKGDRAVLARLGETGFDPNAFARNLIDNFLGDAFRHGMFHADLHPANLMILPGNVVGYIDFGITGVLSPYSRRRLIAMTLAYTRGDLDGMGASFFEVSAVGPRFDADGFREGLKRLAEGWYESRTGGRRLRKNFTLVMLDMLRLSRTTDLWPERDVIRYIRSAIASDGLITRFAPGFAIGAYLEVVCRRYLDWQSWGTVFSRDALLGLASANGRLLRDGLVRGATLLRRLGVSGPAQRPTEVVPSEDGRAADLRRVAVLVIGGGMLLLLWGLAPWLDSLLYAVGVLLGIVVVLWFIRARRRRGAGVT